MPNLTTNKANPTRPSENHPCFSDGLSDSSPSAALLYQSVVPDK
ncbi:hypothetical protein [Neisseria elongata]|nr:hypothetical protein [Neisseria elongata]